MSRPRTDPIIRFTRQWKLSTEYQFAGEPCWEWKGYRNADGYVRFRDADRKMWCAHRWSYDHFRGSIPQDLELDHLCRVRHCVNPNHLEAVTRKVNIHRGETGQPNALKTHCPQGHSYDMGNTYIKNKKTGSRGCRICSRERQQRYDVRKRVA